VGVEAHLLDWAGGELRGARLRVGFTMRLRDEARFPSVDALVTQIRRDLEAARALARAR
jgi:riboflavin kinase/FMN adenylyltransferase